MYVGISTLNNRACSLFMHTLFSFRTILPSPFPLGYIVGTFSQFDLPAGYVVYYSYNLPFQKIPGANPTTFEFIPTSPALQ
jgi:hypothetical protein